MSKLINLEGKKFGFLTVIKRSGSDKYKHSTWICNCDCGNKNIIVVGRCLTENITTSCGKCLINLAIGKRFDRLIVVAYDHTDDKWNAYFKCICDCGTEKIINYKCLKRRQTKSCGCKKREHLYNLNKREIGEACFNRIYAKYKKDANQRGYFFDLSKEYFKKLTKLNCYYCGQEPNNIAKNLYGMGDYIYNGIDRIDNTKGYEEKNVVSCCSICNHAKNSMTKEDFFNWVKKIYNFSVKQGGI